MKLDGKIAVVTGGARGIGLAIARGLAAEGARICVADIDKAAPDAARALGRDSFSCRLDVTQLESIDAMVAEVKKRAGHIDILVNNAAILIDGPGGFNASFFDMTDETLRRTWETNVLAPAAIIRTLLPGMIARGYGRIVNVSSLAGQLAGMSSGFPAYRISKTALNAVTRIAAAEAGKGNIKVNACSPGWVRTDMGGPDAPRSPEKGAETAVWLATLPPDGPTGGFFEDKKAVPW